MENNKILLHDIITPILKCQAFRYEKWYGC